MFYLDPETQKRYTIGRPFSYGGINYTQQGATHATFMSLGFTQVIPQKRPSDKFYIVSGPNADGSYNATPRDLEQLKVSYQSQYNQEAWSILTKTDWYAARAFETGIEIPAEVSAYRASVRSALEAREAQLDACQSVTALEALITAPAQVIQDPMAEEVVMIDNPAAIVPWPVQE